MWFISTRASLYSVYSRIPTDNVYYYNIIDIAFYYFSYLYQGHQDFPCWNLNIPPLSAKIPENSRYQNKP